MRFDPAVRTITAILWDIKPADDGLQLFTVDRVADLAADTATVMCVRHQHTITPGQRNICRQCSALVAALFLDHLNKQDLAAGDDFLNFIMTGELSLSAAFRSQLFVIVIITIFIGIIAVFIIAVIAG